MAGLGRKVFTAGQVLAAADVQGYLQDQAVQVYASSTARSTVVGTAVSEGMVTYLKDSNSVELYDGSAWQPMVSTSAWIDYTPTYTGLTVGNGTSTARYKRIGKIVNFYVLFTLGTTSAVTGGLGIGLPIAKRSSQINGNLNGWFGRTGVAYPQIGLVTFAGDTSVNLWAQDVTASYIQSTPTSATIPFTWASTHTFAVAGTYEAA